VHNRRDVPEVVERIVLGSSLPSTDEQLARLVTAGRGSLAFILGDDASRYRLLAPAINWDRVLLAFKGDTALGYAAFKSQCKGPFSPGLRAFTGQFGWVSGCLRYALFQLFERRECRYRFFLYGLRVSKPARHHGVATALLGEIFTRARQAGAVHVELEVQQHNLRAQQLYLKNGFSVVGRPWLPAFKGGLAMFRVLRMRRNLEQPT
jgi:ribosomal protein S18 acetylase RimI-like enzyme